LKFKSLKLRVLIWFGGILSTILTLFSFAFYYFLEENINLTIQTNLYHKAIYIQENILSDLTKNRLIKGDNLIGLEIAIIKSGKIIAQTESFTLKNFKKYIENENSFFVFEIEEENVEAIYRLNFKKPFKGVILIYQKGINNKAEDVEDTMLVLVPLLLLLLLFAGSKLIDKILIPIKNITKTTKEITVNNFSNTIPKPKYDDEIRELVDSFNDMIERLKEGVERIDRFNSDVSHELKTPLTVIKGEIEITLKKLRDAKYYQQSLKTILFETDQIQTIVQNLLLLTKYTKENIKNSFEICYIDELLLNSINQYQSLAKNKNIKINLNKIKSIQKEANPLLISTIFSNLIDNAIKYTPQNRNIYISLYQKDKIYFEIRDEGIGIDKKQISKITDRFYRVDESRNKKIRGFGLGLSIVKKSVELHNGKLKIKSQKGVGSVVAYEI